MKLIEQSESKLVFCARPSLLISWAILAGTVSCWAVIYFSIDSLIVKILCIVGSLIISCRFFENWRELTLDKLSGNLIYKDDTIFQKICYSGNIKVVKLKDIKQMNTDTHNDKVLFYCNQRQHILAHFDQDKGSVESNEALIKRFLNLSISGERNIEEHLGPPSIAADGHDNCLKVNADQLETTNVGDKDSSGKVFDIPSVETDGKVDITGDKILDGNDNEKGDDNENGDDNEKGDDNDNGDDNEKGDDIDIEKGDVNDKGKGGDDEKKDDDIYDDADIEEAFEHLPNDENDEDEKVKPDKADLLKNIPNDQDSTKATEPEQPAVEEVNELLPGVATDNDANLTTPAISDILSAVPTPNDNSLINDNNAVGNDCVQDLKFENIKEGLEDSKTIGDGAENDKNISIENVQNVIGKVKETKIAGALETDIKQSEEGNNDKKIAVSVAETKVEEGRNAVEDIVQNVDKTIEKFVEENIKNVVEDIKIVGEDIKIVGEDIKIEDKDNKMQSEQTNASKKADVKGAKEKNAGGTEASSDEDFELVSKEDLAEVGLKDNQGAP